MRARNHNHSEACRARIYECLRRDNDPRILAADASDAERTRTRTLGQTQNDPNPTPDTPRDSALDSPPPVLEPQDFCNRTVDDMPENTSPRDWLDDCELQDLVGPDTGGLTDIDDAFAVFGHETQAPDMDLDDYDSKGVTVRS